MGCKHTATYEEVMNARKNGAEIMTPDLNQTQEETDARLGFFNKEVSLKDDIYYLFGGILKVGKRVSEVAKRKLNLPEASITPDNEIKRKMGTKIHETLKEIMDYYVYNKTGLADIRNRAITGEYKIEAKHFEQLVTVAQKTYRNIMDQQNKIDPKGKVKIYTEQFVMDFKKDVGGTIDVLAVFSDNTAAIYDYKTTGRESAIGWGEKGHEVKETLLPYYQSRAYDLSMSEYKRILLERIGVKSIRQNRLIPIALKYKFKPKEERVDGSDLKPELNLLIADPDLSEFLKPIPTGGEVSPWAGLNKLIEKQYKLIDKLSEKLANRGLSPDERTNIQERIIKIEKTIRKTLVDEDIHSIIETITDLAVQVKNRLDEEKTLDKDVPNPSYPTLEELHNLMQEMEVYTSIIQESHVYFKDLKKEDEGKYNTLRKELYNIAPNYENIYASLKLEVEKRIGDVIGSEYLTEEGYVAPFKELGFFELQTSKISQIDNPIFQGAWKLIRDAQYETKEAFKDMDKRVWETTEKLWKWAKDNNMSRQEAYDMMINPKTGNLYARLDPKFYEKLRQALENKDETSLKFIKSSYEFRDKAKFKKEFDERVEAEKGRLKAKYNNFNPTVNTNNEIIRTSDQQKKDYERDLNNFIQRNDLIGSELAWLNRFNVKRYLKIKDEVLAQNYSEEFKKIKSIQPLHEYYEMWHDYMHEFSEILGISDFRVLPDNFIPNVRKEMAEHLTKDKFNIKASFQEFLDSFNVREEDIYISNVDENGERNQIPVLFLNKFRDKNGKIDNTKKSYELSSSLMLFGKMAYNYKYMNSIEPKINALKILMADPSPEQGGIESTDRFHRRIKGKVTPFLTKEGRMTETYKLFKDITDYYLYGIKFKEKSFIPGMDTTHILTKAKNFNSAIKLGFAIVPAMGALTAGHVGVYLAGKKGISFNDDHLNKAILDMVNNRKETNAITAFFDPYNDDYADREFQKYKTSWKNRSIDRLLFSFLRRADVSMTKKVVLAMTRNFGLDKDGKLVRMNKPGVSTENVKSIRDSIKYDKDGNLTVEGMNKESFIQFVAAVKSTMGSVIGNMNPDDIGRTDVGLLQNQMSAFRSWMPEVVAERLGKLKYDDSVDAVKWGRFKAYLSEYNYKISEQEFQDGQKIEGFITNVVIPNLANLVLDLTTFGLVPSVVKSRVNLARAHRMFNKWLDENPALRNKVTFEMFLEVKQGQIKAMLVEMRVILGFLGLALFLGGAGDDGEPRYTHLWLTRTMFKTLNKAGSELTFMWNPAEFERLMRNPFPVTALLTQTLNTLSNGLDETRDFVVGENTNRDMTPKGYYTLQWMKGGSQLARFFEVFENMKKNPYSIF